ncbi:MAG: TraR/DksA C4-type zinc finger protein [Devosia indica]
MVDYFGPKHETRFEALIRDELAELQRLAEGTEADRAPVQLDQQSVGRLSRMDAMQGQALAQASGLRRQARKVALEMALRRLETEEFGDCLDCGEPIALKRLEIDPAATLCISCAQRSAG